MTLTLPLCFVVSAIQRHFNIQYGVSSNNQNAFELPELIHRLSRFVKVSDAISGALVSKAWTNHFVSAIWFKIDFNIHLQFASLSPDVVAKHGHHIRIITNAKTLPQVSILANAGVNNLRNLQIETAASAIQYVHAYEIVFRNNRSLKNLHLTAIPTANKQLSTAYYVSVPALIPSLGSLPPTLSKLRNLKIESMCLTHDGLVFILQGCPELSELRLPFTDAVGTPIQFFQHANVKVFGSTLKSIFPAALTGPSVIEDVTLLCPHLTAYYLEDDTGAIVLNFLTDIVNNVSEIMYRYDNISSEIITTILLHQSTLKIVKHFNLEQEFDFEKEEIALVSDDFQVSGRYMQLIPRCCPDLKELRLSSHEMDMDVVEQGKWACQDLKTLRIRVKGLDTKDKVLKVIALWRKGCWRRWQAKAGRPIAEEEEQEKTDLSIEARVARHLLKFDKLWWVWLGYQTWSPI
ncbi:hypothetical protein BGZ47_004358 [Haplosporangium gracile]|nr:hypothetical protein BGZ47_004358 [Haplosporangium gracile]